MKNIKLKGAGSYLPNNQVSNHDFEKIVDTSDEWIKSRTGISTRFLSETEDTSELGYKAALDALKSAKMKPEEIDLIIVATFSPDNFTPSCACLIAGRLGLEKQNVMAFDINAACSGFIYALSIASALLNTKMYKNALVIGSEVLSKLIDYNDRNTCVLFGDGAGCLVLSSEENNKELYTFCSAKGDMDKALWAEGVKPHPILQNAPIDNYHIKMDGKKVYVFAIDAMDKAIKEVLKISGKTIDDVDVIIPHQANYRIISSVCKRHNVDEKKVYLNLDRYGNTSAASIALGMAELWEELQGKRVLLVGFGAGFTWASAYIEM